MYFLILLTVLSLSGAVADGLRFAVEQLTSFIELCVIDSTNTITVSRWAGVRDQFTRPVWRSTPQSILENQNIVTAVVTVVVGVAVVVVVVAAVVVAAVAITYGK